ncbi:MAG: 3-isopropylmalate/(R)-2-methylmalate dehydratase small subunit [Hyphomicrobiaceae bacterium]|jgi:3-isopropylmalate/(R)-2-methylmalate dehydratase small subunit
MALENITKVSGRAVYVAGDDVDTDRIIPARFMKCVTFDGLGEYLFYDVRFSEDGSETKAHNLNDPRYAEASILIAGRNFGCGSSREHAPQALAKAGFRAVIAEGFAEIFFGNSTTLGMPCATVSNADRERLVALVEADPTVEITINVEEGEIVAAGERFPLSIKAAARQALVSGQWDPIAQLLEGKADVERVARELPYVDGFPG